MGAVFFRQFWPEEILLAGGQERRPEVRVTVIVLDLFCPPASFDPAMIASPCCHPLGLALFLISVPTLLAAEAVQFNREIRPILSQKCLACHGPDAGQRKAELRLDVEESAMESAIVAGQPDASELVSRIASEDPDLQMPPADSGHELTSKEIDLFKRWIAQGAPYAAHWSFVPPVRPPSPKVADDAIVQNAIDHFVIARLNAEAIQPAPRATRETLIRRVTLDLTGLPPTPAEVHTFLTDESPSAFEAVVDRLLKSPRFGEHWARYWLDAARYADTNGYQYDLEREQWVWRDWVINAFNTNMPFDQFTIEQIAGDLLPDATDQQKLATAFHRNHPITIEGGVIDEEYRTEYVIDRVVTTSTVWMGLTMVCGRCHDHKYDPVSQKEFYQFFAYFNQVPEKGNSGFAPKLQISSPLRSNELARLEAQLAEATRRVDSLIERIGPDLTVWTTRLANDARNQWQIVVPPTRRSEGGADLVVQDDQSILATGKNAATEMYELIFPVETAIHAIRLEALTHPSFVGGGTGRGSNGNFVLSELEIAAAAKEAPDDFKPQKIAAAEADYSQPHYPVTQAIDGKIDRTGWAVDGNTKRENRSAAFHLAEPVQPGTTANIRVRLYHRYGGKHHIGRMRLSLAAQPASEIPADVSAIVAIASDKRNAAQRLRLREYAIGTFGSEAQRSAIAELRGAQQRQQAIAKTPATMVMQELARPRTTHVLFRGEYDKPRDVVQAGTPVVLPPLPKGAPANRLGLARWLVMPEHPLTARVTVNRFWQRLFGTGIVKTVDDFGSQGQWPSHPELLDWLAVDFVKSSWNVKALLKQIVMSATYCQSSHITSKTLQRDPDNRLLARGPRLRLDAEVIRDSALLAGGLLSEQFGGPSVFPYHPVGLWQEINNRPGYSRTYQQDTGEKLYRRSLYTFWKRTVPPPSMSVFDAPDREFCVVQRSRTNTPLQAFVMLHDPQFVEAARHLGRRMITEGGTTIRQRITFGFQTCMARKPTPAEMRVLTDIVTERLAHYDSNRKSAQQLLDVGDSSPDSSLDPVELAVWTTVGRVLFNLSEFITKG